MAPSFAPRRITGAWRQGYALDFHTLNSQYVGDDEFGHPRFHTTRSEVGELLYLLKYSADKSAVAPLTDALMKQLKDWSPPINLIVPVPPSTKRAVPPVMLLAEALSKQTGMALAECVTRKGDIPQLKNITDLDERATLLDGLHVVDKTATQGKTILLFDDLYRGKYALDIEARKRYK